MSARGKLYPTNYRCCLYIKGKR